MRQQAVQVEEKKNEHQFESNARRKEMLKKERAIAYSEGDFCRAACSGYSPQTRYVAAVRW